MTQERKRPMALSLAVDEQIEDGSQALRDTMIEAALDEGNSVADIAEALDLSSQAIYKVQAQRRNEPRGVQGAQADQRAVVTALESFTDHIGFEELVYALIGDIDPSAVPLGGPGDRGRDAATIDSSSIFTISLERQWKRKVESDLAKIEKHGFAPDKVYSVTNRRISRRTATALVEKFVSKGTDLTILDQKWLVAKLNEPRYLHLRSGILNIAPPRSRAFLTPQEYRDLLDGRPHLAGLTVEFKGRESECRRAAELLKQERVLLLSGAGGYGKTRLALELAKKDAGEWRFIDASMQFTPESISELPVSQRLVVVIDNAHRRENLGVLLNALERLPGGAPRIVFLARPGYLTKLNNQIAGSHLGVIDTSRTVEIGPLSWRTMAEVLKAPPLKVESPEQRGAIIHLAEGNPQIAIIAARVAAERRSVVGLTGDELLQRYIAYLIPTAIPAGSDMNRQRKLLALLAALNGIEDDDDELIADIAEMLKVSSGQVRDGLEQLAESGLMITDPVRHRIKPDLLAEHVLFALTLTERWELAVDYREIFKRFGENRLLRMVRAIGGLPSGLFDTEVSERLYGIERAVARVVAEGPPAYAAEMIRELCHGRPATAQKQAVALLERTSRSKEPDERVITRLREGAMRMADFPRSWRLLLRLGASCAGNRHALKEIGEAMSATYERVPEGDIASGAVLAAVQDALAHETRRFWDRRIHGAASAVALAVKPMLMVTFEVRRTSPDDPMSFEFGGRILPDSPYTEAVVKTGGVLAAEAFPELPPSEQLSLIETLGWAAHAAGGFQLSMGRRAPMPGRILLDQALDKADLVLNRELNRFEMPVQSAIHDYLLKRARYRRKLADEVEADESITETSSSFAPIAVPTASKELDEYIFLINNRQVGPPDSERKTIKEEYERQLVRARQRAQTLSADPNWRNVVDRWAAWWEARMRFEREPALGTTLGMVFEAVAQADVEFGSDLIDYLVATESELRGSSSAAMIAVIHGGSPDRWQKWLSADATTRAALARALSNFDHSIAAEAMRQLAFDEDEKVRSAATSALAFSLEFEKWRFELSLEAVTRYPDIEAVGQLLHMADERAREDGAENAEFEPHQLKLIEAAILATATSQRIDGYRLADSLRRAERQLPGLTMHWIWARLDELDQMRDRQSTLSLWDVDFLDEELGPIVTRVASAADLRQALHRFHTLEQGSPALADSAKVISWINSGAQDVTDLMIALLEDPELADRVRSHLMDLPLSDEQRDARARAFAAALEEPLPPLLDLIAGSLPRSWSGSYLPHLEGGLEIAERWAKSDQRQLREAGHEAAESYKKQIRDWRAREEIEDLEFQYR